MSDTALTLVSTLAALVIGAAIYAVGFRNGLESR